MHKDHKIMAYKNIIIFCNIIFLSFIGSDIKAEFSVSFAQGMQRSGAYMSNQDYVKNDIYWNLAEKLYNKYLLQGIPSEKALIPKIIHQVWVGSPFPERLKKFQETWKAMHPDWQYILWTEKEIEELMLVNRAAYNKVRNYGAKSDIARYEILYRYGGLYIDTDFECLKPFDILHHLCDFYTGLSFDKVCGPFNGLIAARPYHPILKACIEGITIDSVQDYDTWSIFASTGPYYFTRCVNKVAPTYPGPIILLPSSYFYPWPGQPSDNPMSFVLPESFAIHYWHSSWSK